MNFTELVKEASEQLVNHAATKGFNLDQFRDKYGVFDNQTRSIEFWLTDRVLCCRTSGAIRDLPTRLAGSESSFRGVWHETGSVEDVEHAFQLVLSWLVDGKEVDELPNRTIRRFMI